MAGIRSYDLFSGLNGRDRDISSPSSVARPTEASEAAAKSVKVATEREKMRLRRSTSEPKVEKRGSAERAAAKARSVHFNNNNGVNGLGKLFKLRGMYMIS